MTFPANDLEKMLEDASEDRLDIGTFLRTLVRSTAWVPVSAGEAGEGPQIRTVRIESQPYVRVFTSEEQARSVLPEKNYINPVLGTVLRNLPGDWGLVINPNAAFGFTINAQTIRTILADEGL
ncbi:SseB family protein [Rarobacter incanus]|uniref:Type III secretion system (T3SS) SseB-like protein n=1 Tax=Rarobacter incanus TaxID=153494 RepID=A0A542SQ47_9MICO|nr:SseB family protein [Rarobacter incanus]TQK76740.1 type III secretion system (T3SS) SseB-like protein [Rarobacter incanus]